MMAQGRRLWANLKPTLAERLVFAANPSCPGRHFVISLTRPSFSFYPAGQSHKAVTAHFSSEQLLPSGFAGLLLTDLHRQLARLSQTASNEAAAIEPENELGWLDRRSVLS